jgi:hypothetical protein
MPIISGQLLRLEVSSSKPADQCRVPEAPVVAISAWKRPWDAGLLFLASITSRRHFRDARTLSPNPIRRIQPACNRHEQLLSWHGFKREVMSESPRLVARMRKSKGKGLRT